jgi:hypothetical protein
MGLDQYAYAASKANAEWDSGEQRELAYWRKHPNLQGWMENLWISKVKHHPSDDPTFNGIELELTWEDLDRLEQDIKDGKLPATKGFFFGTDADEYYKDKDLAFIKNARAELFTGLRVFYNSSW